MHISAVQSGQMAFRRREELSVEDEREALREQQLELDDLKRELAERVAAVREREADLARALAAAGGMPADRPSPPPADPASGSAAQLSDLDARERAMEERERELAARAADLAAREQGFEQRMGEERLWLERREADLATTSSPASADDAATVVIAPGAVDLARRESAVEAAEADLARRRQQLSDDVAHLEERERELAARIETLAGRPAASAEVVETAPEQIERIESRLAELREAERLFLRTRDELSARSEAVAARERLAAQKERELDEREDGWGPLGMSDLEERLRRLEQRSPAGSQTATFSGGFRKLQEGSKKPPQRPA